MTSKNEVRSAFLSLSLPQGTLLSTVIDSVAWLPINLPENRCMDV